jgi:Fe-S-cluster-containing hydrogenase component 2
MLRISANRGVFVRAVCLLCVALVCMIGTVQATHSHPQNSTASHHTCSICATAHAGINTQTVASAPVLATAALANSVAEVARIFRPATTQFIRPPPAF